MLALPVFTADAGQLVLDVKASVFGLGAVVSQHQNGHLRVIVFASRVLSDAETRYPVTKLEVMAATWAVQHFCFYLPGGQFLVRSDHKALEHFVRFKDPLPQITHWLQELSEFDYQLENRPALGMPKLTVCPSRPCRMVCCVAAGMTQIPAGYRFSRSLCSVHFGSYPDG